MKNTNFNTKVNKVLEIYERKLHVRAKELNDDIEKELGYYAIHGFSFERYIRTNVDNQIIKIYEKH